MATLLVGADICPIGRNTPLFKAGDAKGLFNDLLPEFGKADLVLANLECPLIERPSPLPKTGPNFGEDPACINGIKAAGIKLLCLANNHIMDHGTAGLASTLKTCESAGISTVGVGNNLAEAREIFVREFNGVRVGIMAVAEREFSIATETKPGANPLDPIDFVRAVNANRERFDYLIVLVHGAAEFLAPTPRIQKTARFMIEMGANAVIVQHPHCLGGCENYLNGHIVYGQGALVMDEELYRERSVFHEGFLIRLDIGKNGARIELIPFTQSTDQPGARKMNAEQERAFRAALDEQSRSILNPEFVESRWLEFCRRLRHSYMSGVLGHNRVMRKVNSTGLLTKFMYTAKSLRGVENIVRCETHREVLETVFHRLGPAD